MREGGREGQAGQSKREAGAEFLLCSCDVCGTSGSCDMTDTFPSMILCGENLCLCNVKPLYYVALPWFIFAVCLGAKGLCPCDVVSLGAVNLYSQDTVGLGAEALYPSGVISGC